MPLVKSGSPQAFKTNVRTLMHEVGKSPHVQSRKQALAIAYATQRRGKDKGGAVEAALNTARRYAAGGMTGMSEENMITRAAMRNLMHEGLLRSSIPGRTDKLPMSVRAGSYVVPADIVSGMGQGNTMAGAQILKNMFSTGPMGMAPMQGRGRPNIPRIPSMSMPRQPRSPQSPFARGGEAHEHVPIVAAGGEYIIAPEAVKAIGHGDMKTGHKVLDRLMLKFRKENIKDQKKLKPPKK
jgi:hypothetical protein